ncbi:RNA-directed DNA polymerase, eukaryota, Reverse transcriptase zinc-binding domain protein [Artemisia annua]|uniref:RNA-directed DNA polymerase, eukaryota, Reverse transcriptase zinc-binding domain protein n=1 Tax=Artemisia annua TaxID=35608 RepID=A0A2U1L5S1_ARTAN|nr:RNA-directed DNA polymerase, eukaryota, Reverse transcriptase zinc-binding domain protein [Artemisia annua]
MLHEVFWVSHTCLMRMQLLASIYLFIYSHTNKLLGRNDYEVDVVEVTGRSGGLINLWNPKKFKKFLSMQNTNFLMTSGSLIEDGTVLNVVNIYAPQKITQKRALWDSLQEYYMRENKFTFLARKEKNFKLSKIDRVLVCQEFFNRWPLACLRALPRDYSDHCPLLLTVMDSNYGAKPFRWFNSWLEREGCVEVVMKAFDNCTFEGPPDVVINKKLSCIRGVLRSWWEQVLIKEGEILIHLKNDIERIEKVMEERELEEEEILVWEECKKVSYDKSYMAEQRVGSVKHLNNDVKSGSGETSRRLIANDDVQDPSFRCYSNRTDHHASSLRGYTSYIASFFNCCNVFRRKGDDGTFAIECDGRIRLTNSSSAKGSQLDYVSTFNNDNEFGNNTNTPQLSSVRPFGAVYGSVGGSPCYGGGTGRRNNDNEFGRNTNTPQLFSVRPFDPVYGPVGGSPCDEDLTGKGLTVVDGGNRTPHENISTINCSNTIVVPSALDIGARSPLGLVSTYPILYCSKLQTPPEAMKPSMLHLSLINKKGAPRRPQPFHYFSTSHLYNGFTR